jgi:transcription initiation factor TFIID subunit TAF12
MSNPTPNNLYTQRWHALLAEHTTIQDEHLGLLSSFNKPFSAKQTMQLNASAARLQNLNRKLHALVDDWSADARPKNTEPR